MRRILGDILPEEKEEPINIFESGLVPKHQILTEDEKANFLKHYNVSQRQLPRIKPDDPVIKQLGGKKGDVVKITRSDPDVGEYDYYRVVA